MERNLGNVYSVLKVLLTGEMRFTDLLALSIPRIGSSASAEKAINLSLELGFTERRKRGLYILTESGRKLIEALEVAPS